MPPILFDTEEGRRKKQNLIQRPDILPGPGGQAERPEGSFRTDIQGNREFIPREEQGEGRGYTDIQGNRSVLPAGGRRSIDGSYTAPSSVEGRQAAAQVGIDEILNRTQRNDASVPIGTVASYNGDGDVINSVNVGTGERPTRIRADYARTERPDGSIEYGQRPVERPPVDARALVAGNPNYQGADMSRYSPEVGNRERSDLAVWHEDRRYKSPRERKEIEERGENAAAGNRELELAELNRGYDVEVAQAQYERPAELLAETNQRKFDLYQEELERPKFASTSQGGIYDVKTGLPTYTPPAKVGTQVANQQYRVEKDYQSALTKGFKDPEDLGLIIRPLDYYKKTYNPDGTLKAGAIVNPTLEAHIDYLESTGTKLGKKTPFKRTTTVAKTTTKPAKYNDGQTATVGNKEYVFRGGKWAPVTVG